MGLKLKLFTKGLQSWEIFLGPAGEVLMNRSPRGCYLGPKLSIFTDIIS
jgi:hypothetical protein